MDAHAPPQAAFTFHFGTTLNVTRALESAPSILPLSDPFSRLFPDVAHLVFEELARVDRPNPHSLGWMRAAQVNTLWRITILGMPRLWARDFLARGYKRGLELFLSHAQTLPLTLDLQLPREVPDLRRMRELLPRTKAFLRSGTQKALSRTLEELCAGPLPLLEELVLSCREQETIPFHGKDYLSMHPKLRTIALHGCYLLVPSHITSLHVSFRGWESRSNTTDLGSLLDTLDRTACLQSLTVHFPEFVSRIFSIGRDDLKADLPLLTDLVLDDPSVHIGEVITVFLKHVDMPSLMRVHVTEAFKYSMMDGNTLVRFRDAALELRDLLSYFGSTPCARDATYLGIGSRPPLWLDRKPQGAWIEAHFIAVHLGTHSPRPSTVTRQEDSKSLSLNLCYNRNPQGDFPPSISRALEAANIPLGKVKALDVDLSPFFGLSTCMTRLLDQCINTERITIGRHHVHESAQDILQALTPSVPDITHPLRQLPFQIESEACLPQLHTIELPNVKVDRIYFVGLLSARYACRAPLRHLVIPGQDYETRSLGQFLSREELDMHIATSLRTRSNVIRRLRGFAASVGATVTVTDTSPQGKPGTCPTEILFNYTPPPYIPLAASVPVLRIAHRRRAPAIR